MCVSAAHGGAEERAEHHGASSARRLVESAGETTKHGVPYGHGDAEVFDFFLRQKLEELTRHYEEENSGCGVVRVPRGSLRHVVHIVGQAKFTLTEALLLWGHDDAGDGV